MAAPIVVEAPTKKKRKIKDLPDELARLTKANCSQGLKYRLETDPQDENKEELMVAYQVASAEDDNNDENPDLELDKLTLDQLRRLCRNVGVHYVNKYTKFQCRRELWLLGNQQERGENHAVPRMGNTSNTGNTDASLESFVLAESNVHNDKKRAYAAVVDLSNVAITIANEMKEANRLAQAKVKEMTETNRLTEQSQMITLAQHLGKREILEEILASLLASGDH